MKNECPECGHTWESATVDAETLAPGEIGRLMDLVIDEKLTDFEREFMASLRPRFEKYHDNTRMSPKQITILRKIAAK